MAPASRTIPPIIEIVIINQWDPSSSGGAVAVVSVDSCLCKKLC